VVDTSREVQADFRPLRVLVYGAGALGQGVGGLLASAGHEVHFLLRNRFLGPMGARGLSVTGLFGDYHVAPDALALHETTKSVIDLDFDYVLITTKAYDTADSVAELQTISRQRFFPVSMQNGCGNLERLTEGFGKARALAARVITGFEIKEPGVVNITVSADSIHLGGPAEGEVPEAARLLATAINSSGLPCETTPHIRRDLFAKLLYNCALNPLGALLRVPYGALAETIHTRAVMETVVREAFAVISAMGERTWWDTAEDYLGVFYATQVPATYHHRSSMLQDLENGKKTEVDALTGYVSRQGRALGCATPVCDTLSHLVRFQEENGDHRHECSGDFIQGCMND